MRVIVVLLLALSVASGVVVALLSSGIGGRVLSHRQLSRIEAQIANAELERVRLMPIVASWDEAAREWKSLAAELTTRELTSAIPERPVLQRTPFVATPHRSFVFSYLEVRERWLNELESGNAFKAQAERLLPELKRQVSAMRAALAEASASDRGPERSEADKAVSVGG